MAADQEYNTGGNAFFLVVFGLMIPFQLFFGIRYKTWGFAVGVLCGLILEVLGYLARIVMSRDQDTENHDWWTLSIVALTIGPAFISAGVYLCLARIITVYGQHLSFFKPRTITLVFMLGDFFALVLQAGGGGLATSDDPDTIDLGVSVLKVGLAIHLAAIAIFLGLSSHLAYKVWKNKTNRNPDFFDLQRTLRFKLSMGALAAATIVILIRTAYRVAEYQAGLDSELAKDETLFFILEGCMMVIASLLLTVLHPGISFQGRWAEANFHFKSKKDRRSKVVDMPSDTSLEMAGRPATQMV